MKFFGSVAAVIDAVLLTGAQVVAGVKTFTNAIVASAGIQLASLWNTNGTGASDVCLKVGTSTADGSMNGGAKLLTVCTGIGGTERERLAVTIDTNYAGTGLAFKNGSGTSIGTLAATATYGFSLSHSYGTVGVAANGAPIMTHTFNGSMGNDGNAWLIANANSNASYPIQLKATYATPGATAIATKIGFSAADGTVNAAAKLLSLRTGIGGTEVEKLSATKAGALELHTVGEGVILASPDGTRYKLTVANGGALSVTAV